MQKKEILTRKFSRAFTGYDIAEVDFFLDELYREFSLMEHELEALRARLAALDDAAQAAADVPGPAAEGRGRLEIPEAPAYGPAQAPAYERPAAQPIVAFPAEGRAADAAAELSAAAFAATDAPEEALPRAAAYPAQADAAAQADFYFGEMYTQAEYPQAEYPQAEESYMEAEEEAAFLVETEEGPGYAFAQEDAAQGPQELE